MAKQQTTDVKVRLLIEGFEGLDKIKSSFRDLGKVTNLTEKDVLKARASLKEIAKEAGNTEAVTAGLISAFKGLRTQVDQSGEAYKALGDDLRELTAISRGASDSLMAQRDAVLASTASTTQNVAALTQQRDALVALRAQTRDSSQAFEQFSGDIQRVETRLENLAEVNKRFNVVLNQATAATAAGARVQIQALTDGINLRRQDIASIDQLSAKQRKLTENVNQRLSLENRLNRALAIRRGLQFQETARSGRENVRTAATAFNNPLITEGYLSPENISRRLGDLPNTTAGLNQELSELNERLVNTYRNTENYLGLQVQLAAVQREATAATQGYAAALLAQLNAGTLIPSQKNLREVIAALRSEMVQLDQTTSDGKTAYAQNAAEVRRLELELNKLANAYRNVSDVAKASPAQGINPYTPAGARNPAYTAQQQADLERLLIAAEAGSLEAIDTLLAAKRTMYEYEANVIQQIDSEKDELNAKDIERQRKAEKAEEEAFQKELQRLDIRQQRIAEAKQAMGFFAQSELSPLYGRIANLGGAEAERQQQFMGRSPTQVFNDIVESFNAGGRPVDLKKRSTAIGGSIAEGVAEGANESAATTTGARTFADKLIKAYRAAFRIKSPSGESEEKIGIPIGQGIGQGVLKGIKGFKAQIKAAILDLTAQVGRAPLPLSMGPGSPLADRAQSLLARSTTRTSTYLPLARLMGEGVLGSEAMSLATQRRMFERQSRVIPLGGTVPGGLQSYPSALSTQDRRSLRGTAGIPGAGLEALIVSAVTKAVSRTGAFTGPLNGPQTITVKIPALQRPNISVGATRATQSPLPLFSAPTQPAPLQATLPGMGYRMGGGVDVPLRGLTGPTGSTAATASLTEAISKYKKATDNFWFSEGSTFEKIRNILSSRAQVSASKGALALSNIRLNTTNLTAAATKLTNLPSTTISNISSLLSGQTAKLTNTLQASGTQLRTQFTKLQDSAETLKQSTAQIFTGLGTGLTQRVSALRTGLTANLPFFGGGGGAPPIPPSLPPPPPPPPPLPPTGGSGESFAKLNNGLKEFGPLSRRSVRSIQDLSAALQEFKNELSPIDDQYALINKKIEEQERLIKRELTTRQRRQRAPLTGSQLAQGAGAAISGGIFGGPEGLIGGLGGLAVGGVGGAFAGAAFGAQAGIVRQRIAETGDYAASIGKLQIALRGVVGSQAAYDTAIRAAAAATRDLNVPQEEATRGLTRLSAAVIGAGGTVGDATFAFRSISEAIKATGGNAEQVDGALLALTQVFSKGKVSAEELNQIAERLPGTFTLFAEASGKTGPELQKALQQGEVGLLDLMKFLDLASERFGETALKISGSSEEAGSRLTVAFQAMRLEVGRAILPLGAELQEAFAGFITSTTPAVVGAVGGIAGALQFFINNDIAAAIGEIILKLGAATLALKAFQAAAASTAGINLVNMLTGAGTGFKITGDYAKTAVPKINGFKTAMMGLGGVLKSFIPLAVLTVTVDVIVKGYAKLLAAKDELKKLRDAENPVPAEGQGIGPKLVLTAERRYTGASREKVLKDQQAQQDYVTSLRSKLKELEATQSDVNEAFANTALGGIANLGQGLRQDNIKVEIELLKDKIKKSEEVLDLDLKSFKTQAQLDAARRKSLEERFRLPADSNEEAEKNRQKLQDALNKREEALLEARQQREEKLADIRVQAAEQAKQIEQDLADTRRSLERELEDLARNRADAAEDSERRIRALRGEDSLAIDAEQRIADAYRKSREDTIAIERRFSDEQENQERTIAEFQQNIAKEIREADNAHTKKMGDIQKQYAKEVAKIVEKGGAKTGKSIEQGGTNAAKQLTIAAQINALYAERAVRNLSVATATGFAVSDPLTKLTDENRITADEIRAGFAAQNLPIDRQTLIDLRYIESIDQQLKTLNKQLSAPPKAAPAAGPSSSAGPNRKPNQNGAQSSLPGEVPLSFDVSKAGQAFGEIASAALIEGLRAKQPSAPGIGDQFTALLGAEGGYEDIAGLKPLPIQRMQQQAARPFIELWKTWQTFSDSIFGPSKEEVKRISKPDPARHKQVLTRIQQAQTAIDNWDPIEAKWKEVDNQLREVKRSKPATMSAASLAKVVEDIYGDIYESVRKAGGLAVKQGERLGSMTDFSDYTTPQQAQIIGTGTREVLSRAYDRSVSYGTSDVNAFNRAVSALIPATSKFKSLIEEILQIEARKGFAYAEKALPKLRLAPMRAARPEDQQDIMDRLDLILEQPTIIPGIQKLIEGASLPGSSFDVSKLGQTFGDTASAALIEGLLAQQPRTTGAIGNMLPNTSPPPNFNDGLGAGRGHQGQDLGLDVGDTIHTRRAGKVVGIIEDFRRPGQRPMGSAVDVEYDNGQRGRYGHVQDIMVQPGQSVAAGQQLGTVFNDGQNSHLHYELRDGFGKLLDPLNVIKESLKVPPGVQGYVPPSLAPAADATTQLRGETKEELLAGVRTAEAEAIEEAYASINAQATQITNSLGEQLRLLGGQRKYLDEGLSPALSTDLAKLDELRLKSINALNRSVALQIKEGGNTDEAIAKAKAFGEAELARIENTYQANIKLTKELEKQNNLLKTRQDDRIGLGLQEGVQSYLESIGTMRDATNQLTVQGIKGLEDAIYDLVTTGKTNFREFAADILRQTARMIIQQLVLRNILMIVKNAFGFESGGVFGGDMSSGYAKGGTFAKPIVSTYAKGGIFDEYAAGGAFAENKIVPFAQGGAFTNSIVTKPTFFKFAAGGAMQNGVMGEAGPEAVMPLKRGPDGRLGVTSTPNSSAGPTNVTVNVDASGSKVQGDSNKSEQLGRAVSQAVQEELVRQKLPGGLLA